MALPKVDLFCPHCSKESGDLWENPRRFFEVECRNCKKKWDYNELNEICTKLIRKEKRNQQEVVNIGQIVGKFKCNI